MGKTNNPGFLLVEANWKIHRDRVKEKARTKYNTSPKRCPQCNGTIPYEKRFTNKFCNSSCSGSYSNRRRQLKPKNQCTDCAQPTHGANKYCNDCISENAHAHRINDPTKHRCDGSRRAHLLRTRPYQCSVCFLTEWMNQPIPLQMDHTDGNPENNEESNLRLLCPNCHALTPTYMGKNKGRGRSKRRELRLREKLRCSGSTAESLTRTQGM